jgi:hypothetical protein
MSSEKEKLPAAIGRPMAVDYAAKRAILPELKNRWQDWCRNYTEK